MILYNHNKINADILALWNIYIWIFIKHRHNRNIGIRLVENEISEQIHFFHLNRNSSGIVVKVDFDLKMTILAHNLYRLLACELPGYSHNRAQSLYDKFIDNYGDVEVSNGLINVKMNRKRTLPLLRESIPVLDECYCWLGNNKLIFTANTHT